MDEKKNRLARPRGGSLSSLKEGKQETKNTISHNSFSASLRAHVVMLESGRALRPTMRRAAEPTRVVYLERKKGVGFLSVVRAQKGGVHSHAVWGGGGRPGTHSAEARPRDPLIARRPAAARCRFSACHSLPPPPHNSHQMASHDSHLRFWPGGGGVSLKRRPVESRVPAEKKGRDPPLPRVRMRRAAAAAVARGRDMWDFGEWAHSPHTKQRRQKRERVGRAHRSSRHDVSLHSFRSFLCVRTPAHTPPGLPHCSTWPRLCVPP